MKTWIGSFGIVAALVACDVQQELQGDPLGSGDGGTTDAAQANDSGQNPGSDSGQQSDGGTQTDAHTGPVSTCIATSVSGSTRIAVAGNESSYFNSLNDLQITGDSFLVFSAPWTFGKGSISKADTPVVGSLTATLPNFASAALRTSTAAVGGASFTTAVQLTTMQDGSGVAALRGSNGGSDRFGQVLAVDEDVYFWKGGFNMSAAVDLVEGTSAANGGERKILHYDTSANYAVTDMAADSTYLYYIVAHRTSTSGGPTDSALYRVKRHSALAPEVVTALQNSGTYAGLILESDGKDDFVIMSSTNNFGQGLLAYSRIKQAFIPFSTPQSIGRTTPFVSDGSNFYYGATEGVGAGCTGTLHKVTRQFLQSGFVNDVVVARDMDTLRFLGATPAGVVIGTSSRSINPSVPGQVLVWAK